jgi:hypothetical protein
LDRDLLVFVTSSFRSVWSLELLFGQTIVALAQIPTEEQGALYLVRLAAFLVILLAIYLKNRPSRSG